MRVIAVSVLALLATAPAQALPDAGFQRIDLGKLEARLPAAPAEHSQRLDPLDGEEFSSVAIADRSLAELPTFAATEATGVGLDVRPFAMRPVLLTVEPFAGHRAFDTMRRRRYADGWRLTPSNNGLGVGMTGTWGIDIGSNAVAMPFVSLDYDRIDTARFVNIHSPKPYIVDNADTGLTLTAGLQTAMRFGEGKRFRLGGYGAIIAATGTGGMAPEAASAGGRIIQSLGSSDLQPLYADVGASLSYAAAPGVRISGSMVQTFDRSAGDAMAMRVALRFRY